MMRIVSVVSRIERHINEAKKLGKEDLSNSLVFNSLGMECFQAVNASIELGEIIVTEKNLGFPSKYKEIFEYIHQAKIIDKKCLDSIKRLVFLRNLISHEYYSISSKELLEMESLLGSLKVLIDYAKKLGRTGGK